jgi:sugar phosphate isomerase/epimerase
MRYANAIWNYAEPGQPVLDVAGEFADLGYDAISFSSTQLARLREEAEGIAGLVQERDLALTMHCSFDVTIADIEGALRWLGDALRAITFDPVMTFDPRGGFYDTARMVSLLRDLIELSDGTGLRVAIEDFPLDVSAVDFYRQDLGPLLECPRYGILIDVGHLNMRLTGGGYFEGMSVADYIGRLPLPIVEVHLHDNNGQKDEHGHFGLGNIDFGEVAAALKSVGFDGVSTIEIAPSFHGSTPAESKPRARESLERWKAIWER